MISTLLKGLSMFAMQVGVAELLRFKGTSRAFVERMIKSIVFFAASLVLSFFSALFALLALFFYLSAISQFVAPALVVAGLTFLGALICGIEGVRTMQGKSLFKRK